MFGAEVQGVFTLFAITFFMLGVIIFALGLLGEYIGRIYQQVRARPRYLVQTILEQRDGVPVAARPLQDAVQQVVAVTREEDGR
jgi:undecaprenyl-phosphate 4-deoxy-4-formamido-L-arabinose transferase